MRDRQIAFEMAPSPVSARFSGYSTKCIAQDGGLFAQSQVTYRPLSTLVESGLTVTRGAKGAPWLSTFYWNANSVAECKGTEQIRGAPPREKSGLIDLGVPFDQEALVFSEEDFQRGFTKTRTASFSEVPCSVIPGVITQLEARLTLSYGAGPSPQISLQGCSELGVGQQSTVTAKGEPDGGAYRFWLDPPSTLQVVGQGATADLTGMSAGRGTLYVEYTAPGGKTEQTSQPAVCVAVQSINGGQPVPKIGLFDVLGKRTSGIRSLPVSIEPNDASDLVVYTPAEPGILTAVNQGDSVLLQGVREGTTTFQAKTRCGGPTGPIVTVEVVPCDDEVLRKLAEEQRIAEQAMKQQLQDRARILGSKDFETASKRIAGSTLNLGVKTGGLIIGTLGSSPGAGKGVSTASDIFGHGSNLLDALKGDPESLANATVQTLIQLAGGPLLQTIASTKEALDAAKEFGEDLGALIATADRLKENAKLIEQWSRTLEDISRRARICRTGTGQPPVPKTDPPAKTDPPKTDPPKPRTDPRRPRTDPPVPPPGEPPGNPPPGGTDEPPAEPPSPPPPTSAPRRVGLPYDKGGKCGCTDNRAIQSNTQGLGELSTGMRNLQACGEQFREGPLTLYQQTLGDLSALFSELQGMTATPELQRKTGVNTIIPRLESLLGKVQEFDRAGRAFYEAFTTCSEGLEAGTDVLRTPAEVK